MAKQRFNLLSRCVAAYSFSVAASSLLSILALSASPSLASELVYKNGVYIYTVKAGDTIESIRARFGANSNGGSNSKLGWQKIAKENNIRNPKSLVPGSELKLQLDWVQSQASTAIVKSVSGSARADDKPLVVGSAVNELSKIITDPKSVVELQLADGTLLKIGSASEVVIERLRQYHTREVIEARIRLEQGRVDSNVTSPRKKPYEVITPGATAAVRGTFFGVSAKQGLELPESINGAATVDVTHGQVQWAKPVGSANTKSNGPTYGVATGFGAAVSKSGDLSAPENLLPAARLAEKTTLEKPIAQIDFPAISGAAAYKIQVSNEPDFNRLVSEAIQKEPQITIISKADGPYYVKVKALSSRLIEGTSATTLFDVAARPLPPQGMTPTSDAKRFEERSKLTWLETKDATYRIQLASAAGFLQPDLDVKTAANNLDVALKVGLNQWRVATIDNGGKQGPFSDPVRIERVSLPPPKASTAEDGAFVELKSDLALSASGNQLEIQVVKVLAAGAASSQPIVSTHSSSPVRLQFGPGTYQLRSRYILPGVSPDAVPLTPAQTLRLFEPVRTSTGSVLTSADGTPIELSR